MNTRKWATCLCLLVALVAATLQGPTGYARAESGAEWSTRSWAAYYGLSGDYLWSVALCESGGNPGAYNADSGAVGLFQFKPSTFSEKQAAMNDDTSDTSGLDWRSVWSADAQAHLAAYLFSRGYGYYWACA